MLESLSRKQHDFLRMVARRTDKIASVVRGEGPHDAVAIIDMTSDLRYLCCDEQNRLVKAWKLLFPRDRRYMVTFEETYVLSAPEGATLAAVDSGVGYAFALLAGMTPLNRSRTIPLEEYLAQVIGIKDGKPMTVQQVIQYVANTMGGVHDGDRHRSEALGQIEEFFPEGELHPILARVVTTAGIIVSTPDGLELRKAIAAGLGA